MRVGVLGTACNLMPCGPWAGALFGEWVESHPANVHNCSANQASSGCRFRRHTSRTNPGYSPRFTGSPANWCSPLGDAAVQQNDVGALKRVLKPELALGHHPVFLPFHVDKRRCAPQHSLSPGVPSRCACEAAAQARAANANHTGPEGTAGVRGAGGTPIQDGPVPPASRPPAPSSFLGWFPLAQEARTMGAWTGLWQPQ